MRLAIAFVAFCIAAIVLYGAAGVFQTLAEVLAAIM